MRSSQCPSAPHRCLRPLVEKGFILLGGRGRLLAAVKQRPAALAVGLGGADVVGGRHALENQISPVEQAFLARIERARQQRGERRGVGGVERGYRLAQIMARRRPPAVNAAPPPDDRGIDSEEARLAELALEPKGYEHLPHFSQRVLRGARQQRGERRGVGGVERGYRLAQIM